MRIRFIQHTAPAKRQGGYQWVEKGELNEELSILSSFMREIDWDALPGDYKGGLLVLPDQNIGIVFKRIKGLAAFDGRDKTTINGGYFYLTEAGNGINGYWNLPFFDDPAEENRNLEIIFNSSPDDYPAEMAEIKNVLLAEKATFLLVTRNASGVLTCKKVLSDEERQTVQSPRISQKLKTTVIPSQLSNIVHINKISIKKIFLIWLIGFIMGIGMKVYMNRFLPIEENYAICYLEIKPDEESSNDEVFITVNDQEVDKIIFQDESFCLNEKNITLAMQEKMIFKDSCIIRVSKKQFLLMSEKLFDIKIDNIKSCWQKGTISGYKYSVKWQSYHN